jgi:hypothetical protein
MAVIANYDGFLVSKSEKKKKKKREKRGKKQKKRRGLLFFFFLTALGIEPRTDVSFFLL